MAAHSNTTPTPINACIIGISGYGRVHYNLLTQARAAGAVQIVGATVINQDEELERCAALKTAGCRIFDDYAAMLETLAGSADLCLIPTGTPLHRPMTVAALQAGMHVLVEKPAAGCIDDAQAMQAAAQAAGRRVAVGYQHLYSPVAMQVKRHLLEGRIGAVQSIKSLVCWPRDHSYYGRNGWAGALTANGRTVNDTPFNNAVAHELMMMLFQAGLAERIAATPVSVDAELYRANAIESADTAAICIETTEGIPIRFYATHACRQTINPEIHIRGSRGTVRMTHAGATIKPDGGDPIALHTGGADAAREAMFAAVLDAVRGRDVFVCDIETASRQTWVVSAIHRRCTIIPATSRTDVPASGPARTWIPGIEEAMREAFDREVRLRDTEAGSHLGTRQDAVTPGRDAFNQ